MIICPFTILSFDTTRYKVPEMSRNINQCVHKNYFPQGSVYFLSFKTAFSIVLYQNQNHTKSLSSYYSAPNNLSEKFLFLLTQISKYKDLNTFIHLIIYNNPCISVFYNKIVFPEHFGSLNFLKKRIGSK